MKTQTSLVSLSNDCSFNYDVQYSSHCPCCGIHLSPDVLYGIIIEEYEEENNKAFLLNYCPNCNECFISRHTFDENTGDGFIFDSSAPMSHFKHNFSDNISKLSPEFVKIYNESLHAEELGLKSICGMGYRKALEFLIKDYIIHKDPDKKDTVISKLLMPCIKDHITDDRLKSLATACTWLGNDETHYSRKHKDYNINDLKIFIQAFVTFVDAELAYENALKLIKP